MADGIEERKEGVIFGSFDGPLGERPVFPPLPLEEWEDTKETLTENG